MIIFGDKQALEGLGKQRKDQYIKEKESELHQDPKFLESFVLLSKQGFNDNFEVSQTVDSLLITSYLNRDYLRESENILIRKYSRKTNVKVSVIGTVSQYLMSNNATPKEDFDGDLSAHMRNMFEHLASVEYSISGKSDNEIVIDPIAAYIEL